MAQCSAFLRAWWRIGRVDEVKLAFVDNVKIKMAGRNDLRDKGATKTWCRGRSQRPYFARRKERKGTRRNPHRKWSVSKPRPSWEAIRKIFVFTVWKRRGWNIMTTENKWQVLDLNVKSESCDTGPQQHGVLVPLFSVKPTELPSWRNAGASP